MKIIRQGQAGNFDPEPVSMLDAQRREHVTAKALENVTTPSAMPPKVS